MERTAESRSDRSSAEFSNSLPCLTLFNRGAKHPLIPMARCDTLTHDVLEPFATRAVGANFRSKQGKQGVPEKAKQAKQGAFKRTPSREPNRPNRVWPDEPNRDPPV